MKRYLLNALVGLDQFANTILGGHPGETISARSGRAAAEGKFWGKAMRVWLDRIQPRHCENAELHDAERAETVEQIDGGGKF